MKLSKLELKALLAFAGGANRPALNGVLFEANAAVASDGHRLTVLVRASECMTGQVVPRATLESVYKVAKARDVITIGPAVVMVGSIVLEYTDSGSFPYYKAVIPERDDGEPRRELRVNPEYLADLAIVSKATRTRAPHVTIYSADVYDAGRGNGPIVWTIGDEWHGVIMPLVSE